MASRSQARARSDGRWIWLGCDPSLVMIVTVLLVVRAGPGGTVTRVTWPQARASGWQPTRACCIIPIMMRHRNQLEVYDHNAAAHKIRGSGYY